MEKQRKKENFWDGLKKLLSESSLNKSNIKDFSLDKSGFEKDSVKVNNK